MKKEHVTRKYILDADELLDKLGIKDCYLESIYWDNWLFNKVAILVGEKRYES